MLHLKRYLTIYAHSTWKIPEETTSPVLLQWSMQFSQTSTPQIQYKTQCWQVHHCDCQFPPQPNSVTLRMEWAHSSKTMELILYTAVWARICWTPTMKTLTTEHSVNMVSSFTYGVHGHAHLISNINLWDTGLTLWHTTFYNTWRTYKY